MSKQIRIVWIPNQIKKDGRIEKKVDFVRGTTLREYLDETKFTYGEGWHIISARFGKIKDVDAHIPDGDDEILIMRELKDPFSIGMVIMASLGASIATAAAYATLVGTLAILAAVAVVGFAIFSAFQKPKRPSFGAFGGAGSGSLEDSSPTYGWDGVRTVQDVGIPVGLIYGTHKVGGNIINQYTWNDGNKEYLNLLIALGEGVIDSISDITINDNPFENFTGLTKYERYGTNDQTIIEGFEQLHNVVDVGAMLVKDTGYVYTTQDDDVEAFEVEITCPYGLYEVTNGGDQISTEAKYKVEYRTHGSGDYTDLGEQTITDSSRTTVRRKYRKEGLTPGKYDIRVTRTSDDSTTMKIRDLRFNRLDEIKNEDLAYPNTALLGLKLLANDQLSGAVPNINCIVKGMKIKTYKIMNGDEEVAYDDYYWDPATSQFKLLEDDTVLTWDGETYSTAYSANPVWIIYDLIVNNRYGLGEFIEATYIDLAQFVEMAKYCDEKLPDGEDGYEKRFELNVVLDSAHSALDILIQLTASFRAWVFYSAGTIKLKIDKAETPTQMFGMGNIIEGTFQQTWKALKDVPNVIDVQYLDKDKNYEQEIVAYIDETSLATNPMRKRSVRVFVTKMSRAVREARYALLISQYIHRSISFKASIDAIACQAGDVIAVTHDVPNWGNSGRVKSGTANTVVLDQNVTIVEGTTYKIQVRHAADDTIEEKTVTTSAGSTATLAISGTWTTTPAAGDVWFFGETNVYKKNFRIISMRRGKDNEIEIQAMEHSTLVFDDTAPTLPDSNYTDPTAGIPSVENLALTERIVKMPDGTIQNVIDVWWTKPDTSAYPFKQWQKAKIYLSDNAGTTYALQGESDGTSFSIQAGIQESKAYKVCVTSVNMIGEEKSITLCPTATITVMGKLAPPSDVTGFAASFAGDHIHFTWNHITDVDLDGYEIRELPYSTAPWSLGIPIGDRVSQNSFDYFLITSLGNRYFAIKAIDTTGNYSTQAAYASLVIVDLPNLNVIETIDFDLTDGALSGAAERILFKGYSEDFYRTALSLMTAATWDDGGTWDAAGGTWDAPVTAEDGTYITEVVDLGGNVETSVNLSVGIANTSGGRLTAYIAYSDSDSTPDTWVPFANGQYTGRYFRFKLVFSSDDEDETVTIYQIKAVFDVPDKEEYGLAVPVSDTGWTTVTFTESYIEIKALLVSVTGGALIAELDQTDLPASFDVKLKDGAGSQQAGTINWWAKGY